MRWLHNKVGFFLVGLVIIYTLSGIVQTYRDTNFLKHDVAHAQKLPPNLPDTALATALKLRNLKITKTEGNIQYFKEGTYNKETGIANYTTRELYSWITPFTSLHKTASKSMRHYFTIVFAVALLFMSISAFWMFKPGTRPFSSGVLLTIGGIIGAILLLLL